jgi:cell division protease FtsH
MKNTIKRSPGSPSFDWRPVIGIILIWLIFMYFYGDFVPKTSIRNISYSQFKKMIGQGKISEVTIKGDEISGKLGKNASVFEKDKSGSSEKDREKPVYIRTIKPAIQDPELLPMLETNDVEVRAELQKQPLFWTIIVSLLPWLLIFGLFLYASKKMQERMAGGRGGIFGFAKSKAKLYNRQNVTVTYDDVAGMRNVKKELQEMVAYLKDPSKFKKLGGELPKGLLLVGPPGVGKTLLAQATAGEANVPFYSISGSEFIEMFVGVGASRVRDMFKRAKKDAPAIIFIDELDSIGRVRGTGLGGGHDEREQTLNQILAEMDGFSHHESLVVLAATNRPDVLDPALIRPGRFDRRITIDLPRKKARKEILHTHTRDVPLADGVDMDQIAGKTVGLSGAELKNLVNEATLIAARNNKERVESEDFDQARDKILMGIQREDIISEKEKESVAYHEAGHALLAELLPYSDPLQKVSIIPRGRAMGATEQIPEEDRYNLNRNYLLDRIGVMLGGRAAERIVFEDISTGAGDDLKKATQLARRMVCQWGMSETLGPVTFRHGEPHPFLGKELSEPKDFSEHTARLIDEEVRKILSDTEKKVVTLLTENRKTLDHIARQLLEHETLNREELNQILNGMQENNHDSSSGDTSSS